MDVEELRASARLAPEHEAEPTPPIDQDKALVAFMERFADAMLSTAEAAVSALDKACEQITGVKPLPGEGVRALYQAAEKALLTAVKQAINPPPLSKEALLVKEAAIVAAATAVSVDDVIAGMKRLGKLPEPPPSTKPSAHLLMNGRLVASTSSIDTTLTIGGREAIEFTWTPDADAHDHALFAHEAVKAGWPCTIQYEGRDYNVDHEFIGRFRDAMRDGFTCGMTVEIERLSRPYGLMG